MKARLIPTQPRTKTVIAGDFTIKDVVRDVKLAVDRPSPVTKDPWGKTRTARSGCFRSSPHLQTYAYV